MIPPRTTATSVRELLTTSLSDPQINSWIAIASSIVDNYAARCTLASAAVLIQIETLITCHLIVSIVDRSKTITSKTIGSSSESYMAVSGDGIMSSPYGQQARMLDPCGVLGQLQAPRAFGEVL